MSIKINLITDYMGAGVQKAIKEFKQLETTGQKAQFAIRKAAVPAGAALAAFGGFMVNAAKGAEDARIANQKLGNVFKSMGVPQASARVSAYAEQLEKVVAVDADVIKATQTKLATFSNLTKTVNTAGGAFDRATKASLDLASAGFGTAESNAVQLGKALQDPIKGITALAKAGVTFTDQEKEKIRTLVESGKMLEAQEVVLRAIEKQVGGTAEASASSFAKMKFAIAGVSDTFGDALLPVIDELAPKLQEFSAWAQKNPGVIKGVTVAILGLTTATLALNAAMAVNPYVAAAAGIAGMAYAFERLYREIDKVNKVGGVGARILGAIFGGPAGAVSGMNKVRDGVWSLFGVTSKATDSMAGLNKAQIENAEINGMVASGLITLTKNEDDFTESTGAGTKALDARLAKIKALRKEIAGDFKSAIDRAKSVLGDAQKAFNDFAKSVSDSITSSFSFKAAQEAGAETGRGFLASLTDQVAKTRDFAVKINRLLAAGLSEGALQQVLAAGQEAGGAIADELLNGGAAAIAQANALTAEVASLGTNVGQNAAVQFRQAGVDAGTAMVAGITEAISKFQVKLRSKKLTPRQLARLQKDFGVSVDFLLSGGQASIPALADGGIVKASPGGTLALIGEGGKDEAVIPLDRMGSMGGNNVTIHVNGGDPNAVVDALRRYMQLNGSVPIRIAN